MVIKLIERWNKSDDISLRHREDIIREIGDLSEKISYISGRLNGKGNGQFKSNGTEYKLRLGLLDRYNFRGFDVRDVYSTDLLPIFKNKKDKGAVNGLQEDVNEYGGRASQ